MRILAPEEALDRGVTVIGGGGLAQRLWPGAAPRACLSKVCVVVVITASA